MAAAAAAGQDKNYYDVLGTRSEATPTEIKQSYKRAARHWHPDKAHEKDKALAERRFKEVSEAYTVLSDERLRQVYDLYLRCRPYGLVEVADPDDPRGEYVQVPFSDWQEFRRLFEVGLGNRSSGSGASPQHNGRGTGSGADDDAGSDAPLSVLEWLVAGGIAATLWCFAVWRHQRRHWLEALPFEIWRTHCEYAAPLAMLMSPFFFGNVPFRDAADWFRAAVHQAHMDSV